MAKINSLNEAAFEDVVMAALAASPLYTTRGASHFDAATLLDAGQLWDFIAATQPRELAKLYKQFPDAPRSAGGTCNGLDSETRHVGGVEEWRVV